MPIKWSIADGYQCAICMSGGHRFIPNYFDALGHVKLVHGKPNADAGKYVIIRWVKEE